MESIRKPYAFVGFGPYHSVGCPQDIHLRNSTKDTFMSKTARLYRDTRAASAAGGSNLDRLNDELQDVTRIMTKNMEELLWRGDSLDSTAFACQPCCFDDLIPFVRNVAPLYVAPFRVRKVPQGSKEYQHPGHATTIRSLWRCRYIDYHLPVVALFMKSTRNPYCSAWTSYL